MVAGLNGSVSRISRAPRFALSHLAPPCAAKPHTQSTMFPAGLGQSNASLWWRPRNCAVSAKGEVLVADRGSQQFKLYGPSLRAEVPGGLAARPE